MTHEAFGSTDGGDAARGGRAHAPAHPGHPGARGAGRDGIEPDPGPKPAARLAPPETPDRGRPGRTVSRRRLDVLPPGRAWAKATDAGPGAGPGPRHRPGDRPRRRAAAAGAPGAFRR